MKRFEVVFAKAKALGDASSSRLMIHQSVAVFPPGERGEESLVGEGADDLEYSPSIMPEGEIPAPMRLDLESDEEFHPDSFVPVTPPDELGT